MAIETNGTCELPSGIDHVCISPKPGLPLKLKFADELKVIYPVAGSEAEEWASKIDSKRKTIQPIDDGVGGIDYTQACVEFCLSNPGWNLSLQTHKTLGLR